MCCLLHSSGTCSIFSALCSEMQLFPPFLPFVPPYSLFIWINLKMCLHVIGDTHLRGLWHFPIMNILNIFAEASGVRMLECLYSNIRRSGLGEDFSGRSFQKVYKNVHSHVSYLSSASRMWNLWLTGQIKSATFSFFVLAKKAWLEHSHQLVTNCLQLLLWNNGRAESLQKTSWPAQSEIFTIHPLQKKFANHSSISL